MTNVPASQSPIDEQSHIKSPDGRAQDMPPALYVVATPIGNLRDITLRALDVLQGADHVLAEDTRQSKKLLEAYSIQRSLTPYHDHNAAKRIPAILALLAAGETVALISDAGTPLVSDPGFKLARAAIEAGHRVVPLPGASAPLAALVTAGLPSDRFMFAGFLPPKSAARRGVLGEVAGVESTLIFFETGPRLTASLGDMLDILGDRSAAVARELTKTYEETRRGTLSELCALYVENGPPRGEIVIVTGPPEAMQTWDQGQVDKQLMALIPQIGVKRASAEVAARSGHNKREVYARALSLKDS